MEFQGKTPLFRMTSADPDYTAAYSCDEIEEQAALEQHGLQELLNICKEGRKEERFGLGL